MEIINDIEAIKTLVDSGEPVYAGSKAYRVYKEPWGEYRIICDINQSVIGLHGMVGTEYENRLNMSPIFIEG